MNLITQKTRLNKTVTEIDVLSPQIAKKAQPGQFIILRATENGERIPLTIADCDKEKGTVKVIYQIVGATTLLLDSLNVGDYICDFAGPLGTPTKISGIKKAAVIGGGVGCAIAFPVARGLVDNGAVVDSIIGFRTGELVILEDRFKKICNSTTLMTDDGSLGQKGLVTTALEQKIIEGNTYDEVFAIGPLVMMKFICLLTKKYDIKTTVSMNPIMIDGTGMCGCCRLTVDGKIRFACVDGPDFDGHSVDFDEAIARSAMYKKEEQLAHSAMCNLLKKADF